MTTEKLPLDLPAIDFTGTAASADAARRVYDLHADLMHGGILPVGYEAPPDEFVISQVLLSLQGPWVVPSGFYGRVALALDPGGRYVNEVGFKDGIEDGHPRFLKPLGFINLAPGVVPFIEVRPSLIGPITYRKGDLLIVAPETNNVNIGSVQIFMAPIIESAWGDFKPAAGVVHAIPLNGSAAGGAPACYRSVFPAVSAGGSQIRFHFSALGDGLSLGKAAAGIRTGAAADMAATPVPLTFGGNAGLTLPAWGEAWSDWATLATTIGQRPAVNLNVAGAWAFKGLLTGYVSPAPSWYSATDSHASAAMLGTPAAQPERTHCVDCVQVQ